KTSQIEAFDANSYILGATIPAWGGTIRLSGLYSEGTNSKPLYTRSNNKKNPVAVGPDAGYWSVAVGYSYPFSKRTNIYGVISHLEGLDGLDADDKNVQAVNDDGSMSRTQIAIGLVHKF
ncbi:MAG: hypothetical protein Q4E62_07740, partial [Sutterellaceae bacterium]|nr:hypothetical protein [Sutterellaceae bacterium]